MTGQLTAEPNGLAKSESELKEKLFGQWLEFFRTAGSKLSPEARSLMITLRVSRRRRLEQAINCRPMPECVIRAMHISEEDAFALYSILQTSDAPASIQHAWPRLWKAINSILDIHGSGKAPIYPIDKILHDPTTGDYISFIREFVSWELSRPLDEAIPISDALDFAVILLCANCRDDAIRLRPLETAGLFPTLERARSIKWDDYRYAAILVPGQGPERAGALLAPLAMMKMRRAVIDYRIPKAAPFLIVSGGAAHPPHTKINEAHEMREWLINEFGLDPGEVVTEPYARHTTTNLRNTWRVLRELGAPLEKSILVVTDKVQIEYICSIRFEQTAQRELGYMPCAFHGAPHDRAVEVHLNQKCHVTDPSDPMDP